MRRKGVTPRVDRGCGPDGGEPWSTVGTLVDAVEYRTGRTAGLNNAEVAATLFLSGKTVEGHLTRVYRSWASAPASNWPPGSRRRPGPGGRSVTGM